MKSADTILSDHIRFSSAAHTGKFFLLYFMKVSAKPLRHGANAKGESHGCPKNGKEEND
jgi:hypothetical protein